MKIALVSPYDFAYPGGVVAHISHLSRYLEDMGHTVKIIAPATSPGALGIDNLIAVGRPLPIPTNGSIARISLSVWKEHKIKSLLRDEAFDIIHLHEPLAPVLPLTVLRLSESVNVGTFHAFKASSRMYGLGHRLVQRWFNKLDVRIAVSQPARQFISKFFPAEYRVVSNGIEVDFFARDVPPLGAFKDEKLNILFVGRLEKRKGLKYLLSAYSKLKWEHPNIRLIVVGPGNPGKECYRIMAERNLQDVVFAGGVDAEALRRYYQTADVFCSPATGKESFGIVLGEAMASGKPIVASNIEGFASIMTHGQEGLLVPPKNDEALAAALKRLILDSDLRQTMGERGRVTVQAYRWDRVAKQIVELYEEALTRHRATPALEAVVGR